MNTTPRETVRIGRTATVHFPGAFGAMCNGWNTGKRIVATTDAVTCKRCIKLAAMKDAK